MNNFFSNNSLLASSVGPSDWYWDPNQDASGIGGNGEITRPNFFIGYSNDWYKKWRIGSSTGPLEMWPLTKIASRTAIFDGVAGNARLLMPFYVNKVIFLVNNYILSQDIGGLSYGLLMVGKDPEIRVATIPTATAFLYTATEATTLNKTGSGILEIGSNASLSNIGTLNIRAGTVKLTIPTVIASTLLTINNSTLFNGGTATTYMDFANTSNLTFPTNISGNGTIRKSNSITNIFTGNNTNFTGSYDLISGAGYVAFSNDNAVGASNVGFNCLGSAAGFYFTTSGNTLSSTRTITLNAAPNPCNLFWNGFQNNTNTIASLITGVGSITKQSYETHILTNNNTYTGSTNVRGVGSTAGAAEAVLRVSSGSLGGTSGQTADFGNIVFQDTGTNGILEFNTAANLGPCSQIRFRNTGGVVGYGGALRYIGSTNETVNKTIQCDTSIGIRLESNSTGAGSITYNGTFSQTNRGLYLAGTGTGVLNNVFSGTGSVNKRGSGSWTLGGNNTYSGGTNITAGTLKAGVLNAFGTGTITISAGATLDMNFLNLPNIIVNNGGSIINAP